MTTHLIVCATIVQWPQLLRLRVPVADGIVASDDRAVHELARAKGYRVVWLEETESFFAVAEEVKEICDLVTAWLGQFADDRRGMPANLLFWMKYAEGGYTTQRVQDVLLLVRSYLKMLQASKPGRLTVLANPGRHWEMRVLAACAESLNVPVASIGRWRFGVLRGRLRDWANVALREPYALLIWCSALVRSGLRPRPRVAADVLLQVCDSATKHVSYAATVMHALVAERQSVAAVCWRATRGASTLRRQGLRADDLERWLSFADFVRGILRGWNTWRIVRRRRNGFESLPTLHRYGLPLGRLLWPSVRFFLRGEISTRWHMMRAAEHYFSTLSPLLMRFWTTVFPQAVIVWRSIPEDRKPLVFHAPGFPYYAPDPYYHRILKVDLEFAVNSEHKAFLEADPYPNRRIIVVGHDRWEAADRFAREHTQAESRRVIGVPVDAPLVVMYEAGYVARGYLSSWERNTLSHAMLTFAASEPSIHLVIKPHPSHRAGELEARIGELGLPNVHLVASSALPHHCINASDVVLTKFSTVGIEAIYFGRPVVSALLDREIGFRMFGGSADYFEDVEALTALFAELVESEARARWMGERSSRLDAYNRALRFEISRPPSELLAAAIAEVVAELRLRQDVGSGTDDRSPLDSLQVGT